ncbi:DMT family transporter [Streptomyces sulfonofaciens]|uniref:DMT family transporter n=1 Tax=Streptomyces sulfonofaciens TaxID=68272 RepID=UPI001674CAA2|nr:DMT family transporter [Streptomyces sulfonofaciens]
MNALTVALALLAATGNGAASVLQRRAAVDQKDEDTHHPPAGPPLRRAVRRLLGLLRRRYWLAGFAAMVLAAAFQAGALTVGELSVVQPLLASELLFTLLLGSLVFRHRPDVITWLSFLMLAVGLGLFMGAAAPTGGSATSDVSHWLPVGACLLAAVAVLGVVAHSVHGTPRATVLGAITAVGFACTAALIKEVTGRLSDGESAVFTSGYLYATGAVGLLSFLMLQATLRAGTLAASQPALTLGDALVSVVLGWALFGEKVSLGGHPLAGVLGVCLIAGGTTGLARSPAVHGEWDTAPDGGARRASSSLRRALRLRMRGPARPSRGRRRGRARRRGRR